MIPVSIRDAVALGESVLAAREDRAFDEAVGEFADALATVPDLESPCASNVGGPDVTDYELAALQSLCELVIERVDACAAADVVNASQGHALIEQVCGIRRALDAIDHRRRHYHSRWIPSHGEQRIT